MRKELLATLLTSAYWMIAGFFVAYAAWERGYVAGGANNYPAYQSPMPDPFALGLVLLVAGLLFSFVVLRALLPARATQRRRLMRLLDEAGIEDVETIQRRLTAISDEYGAASLDRAASLEALLHEQKRKRRAD